MGIDAYMAKLIEREIERKLSYIKSPLYRQMREEFLRGWYARPWYERLWLRTKQKVMLGRRWLGSIIAGEPFE